jgi:hypothetical protein
MFIFKYISRTHPSSRTRLSPFWTATLTIVKDIANHFAVSVLPSMHHPRYFRVGNGQHIIYKIGVYQDPLVFY